MAVIFPQIMLMPQPSTSYTTPSSNVYISDANGFIFNVGFVDAVYLSSVGGMYITPRDNISNVAPTVNDDYTKLYGVGSIWRLYSTGAVYMCTAMATSPGGATWSLIGTSLPGGIVPTSEIIGWDGAAFTAPSPAKQLRINSNVVQWGFTEYPHTTFYNTPNAYLIGDAGDTSSDASFVMAMKGRAFFEEGMVGTSTDGVINQSWFLKDVKGATFTGEISGTTLTVTTIEEGDGEIGANQQLSGLNIATNTIIQSQLTGSTGSTGTYQVNNSQTVASTRMTSERYFDRIGLWQRRSPRYPHLDIFGGENQHTFLRLYPNNAGKRSILILGTATGTDFPGRTGEGLIFEWDPNVQIGRIYAATWNAYARDISAECNSFRITTGAVFQLESMQFTNKGAQNIGAPIQIASKANVSNSGPQSLAEMRDYVPGGTEVLTAVVDADAGTAPQFPVSTTQVVSSFGIPTAGTGGTQSTSTTLSLSALLGATTVFVTSSTGFATGNTVLIKLNNGFYHRTTITVSGTTWTLADSLGDNAAAGLPIYLEQTVQPTAGTASPHATISVRINAAGGIAETLYFQGGEYTINPPDLTNVPVAGAGLGGSPLLSLRMGAKTLATPSVKGRLIIIPNTPTATTSNLAGTGAVLDIFYENERGTVNAAIAYYANGLKTIDTGGSLLTLNAPRVIFVGDSLTAGQPPIYAPDGDGKPHPYSSYIALNSYKDRAFSTQVVGVAGSSVASWQINGPTWLEPLYQVESLTNIVLIWLGTNDIAAGTAPATVWTNLQSLCSWAKGLGFKVGVGTPISRVGHDTNLDTLGDSIRAGWAAAGIDFLVDFGGNANLAPDGSNYSDTTYYLSDEFHLNLTGEALAGSIAQAALNTYIGTLSTAAVPVAYPQIRVDLGAGRGALLYFADGGTLKYDAGKTAANDFVIFDRVRGANVLYVNGATGTLGLGETGSAGVNIGNPSGGDLGSGTLNVENTVRVKSIAPREITYANRPGGPVVGEMCNFSDSTVSAIGATIAGGGSNHILGRWNGTNWTVVGA